MARRVCSRLASFRRQNRWGLVLKGREVETALRSRVHTFVESRDRYAAPRQVSLHAANSLHLKGSVISSHVTYMDHCHAPTLCNWLLFV